MPKTDIGAWFKFYAQDWQASVKNSCFTLAQEGAYIRLLCRSWEHGGIPDDTKKLATLLGVSRQEFEELWDGLGDKWDPHPDDTRLLVNRRQEAVRASQSSRLEHGRERQRRYRERHQGVTDPSHDALTGEGLQDSRTQVKNPTGSKGGASAPPPKRTRVNGAYELKLAATECLLPVHVAEACEAFRSDRVGRRPPLRRTDWAKLFHLAGNDHQALLETLEAGVTWMSLLNPLKDRLAKRRAPQTRAERNEAALQEGLARLDRAGTDGAFQVGGER